MLVRGRMDSTAIVRRLWGLSDEFRVCEAVQVR